MEGVEIRTLTHFKLGNEHKIWFWIDKWCGKRP